MSKSPKLNPNSNWVNQTLAAMTLTQKIGQLLHPSITPSATPAERDALLGDLEPGGVFLFSGSSAEFQDASTWFQQRATVPLVISSDLENGAGRMIEDATVFPRPMALGATNDPALAYDLGRATAQEGLANGVHWTFSPVVDMCAHPFNPDASTRTLGDDPDRIARLSSATVRGLQDYGMAATVKHFPGSGFDDRDQHLCTTINPLRMDDWFRLSGRMFQENIDAGVWTMMIGHLSLPAWDPGDGKHWQSAPPATISPKIVTGLLREKMGFDGVIITDALDMAGVTAWGTFEEIIPAVIEAGCDMFLFCDMQRDFDILLRAVESGRISEARIDESVRRILALKEALGLNTAADLPALPAEDQAAIRQNSVIIAEKGLTLVKDANRVLPLDLSAGKRVLSYHLRDESAENVDYFDQLLQARGVTVSHYNETDHLGHLTKKLSGFDEYDAIIINVIFSASWGTNKIRPAGNYMRDVWSLVASHHRNLILVSYGSPYIGYEMPTVPLYINAYSSDTTTQEAVLKLLTGEIEATGTSPVDLDAPYRLKGMEALRY